MEEQLVSIYPSCHQHVRNTGIDSGLQKVLNQIKGLTPNQIYPQISLGDLEKVTSKNYKKYFEIDQTIGSPEPKKYLFTCSFFRSNPNSSYPGENPRPDFDSEWRKKYFDNFLKLIRDIDTHFPDWNLDCYIERDLYLSLPLPTNGAINGMILPTNVRFHVMKHNSEGAIGASWRFLSLTNKSYEIVCSIDIDEPVVHRKRCIDLFKASNCVAQRTAGVGLLAVKREEESWAHTSFILAGRLIVRPRGLLNLNIHDALPRFYDYWIDFMCPIIAKVPLDDRLPWYKRVRRNGSMFSSPYHNLGVHSNPYSYGFDETFLKYFLYYFLLEKGTQVINTGPEANPIARQWEMEHYNSEWLSL